MEIDAGGQSHPGSGGKWSLKQGLDSRRVASWRVFLNSLLPLTLSILNVCYLQGGIFTGIKRAGR